MASRSSLGRRLSLTEVAAACLFGNAVFALFLLIRPLSDNLTVPIGDLALTLGLLGAAALCLLGPPTPREFSSSSRFVPYLLGTGVLLGAATAALFAYYDLRFHHPIPQGSLADVLFVAAHLFALPTLLLLPAERIRGISRVRATLDGVLVLVATSTFAWYFLLGPLVVSSHASPLAKLSQIAYPVSDLFLIACLLVLSSQFTSEAMRPTAGLLSLGLAVLLVTDGAFVYVRMHDAYKPASLLDIGWLAGGTLAGLASLALKHAVARGDVRAWTGVGLVAESRALHLWRSLVPYWLVLAIILFTLYLWAVRPHDRFGLPVDFGAVIVVLLALMRQLLAILENARLIGRLDDAYRSAVSQARKEQELNEELREARGAVEDQNRALAETNARLERLATTDALTGLVNRTLFHDRLQKAIEVAQRTATSVAVLLIDLDAFKDINDSLGHHLGDAVLEQIGQELGNFGRSSDTVARLGGDEFALVLPGADARSGAALAGQVLRVINQPIFAGDHTVEMDASIGMALYPEHGDDATSLLQRADIAMYQAKRSNIGYVVYQPHRDFQGSGRVTLATELRRAIETDQLVLHYQPKIDLRTGLLYGYEALVRWQHPDHGSILPGEFIPLAERTGLITPLTEWVLDRAHHQWLYRARVGDLHPVAINLSPRSLSDERLLALISARAGAGIDAPSWLHVELTESSLVSEPDRAMTLLNRLHRIGVRIAIDDFGTGYSSLAYLKRLPVDEIKIDRSFVLDMVGSQDDAVIVRSVIDLAHNLGLSVTAEGVEGIDAAEMLMSMGCDLAQGYLYGRPAPLRAADGGPAQTHVAGGSARSAS